MNELSFSTTTVPFGVLPDGREASLIELRNSQGWKAQFTDFGATLVSLKAPTHVGDGVGSDELVLGFKDIQTYIEHGKCVGSTCGRVANRTRFGRFQIGEDYCQLALNEGPHHLHGGPVGFHLRLWRVRTCWSPDGPAVKFELESDHGDQGYPGKLQVEVTYVLAEHGQLVIDMSATSDRDTVVNLAHHSYWNLSGGRQATILGHQLTVCANEFLPVGEGQLPTGELMGVAGSAFDLRPEVDPPCDLQTAIDRLPKTVRDASGGGFDHCYVVRDWRPDGSLRPVATLQDPVTRRRMTLLSDQPGLQVYTGNRLGSGWVGSPKVTFPKHAGICLETQFFPDALNHPHWPQPRIGAGHRYQHRMVHVFDRIPS